jgi:hypothetical protein
MGRDVKRIAGNVHEQTFNPGGVMKKGTVDPLGTFAEDAPMAESTDAGPMVMPDADSEAVAAARRRKMAAMKNRGGRASTILGGEDRLGGG